MTNIITNPGQVTPERLTEILRVKGHLPPGEVITVEQKDSYTTTTSLIVRFYWWNSPQLETIAGTIPSEEKIKAMLEQAQVPFTSFVDFMGDRLSSE